MSQATIDPDILEEGVYDEATACWLHFQDFLGRTAEEFGRNKLKGEYSEWSFHAHEWRVWQQAWLDCAADLWDAVDTQQSFMFDDEEGEDHA